MVDKKYNSLFLSQKDLLNNIYNKIFKKKKENVNGGIIMIINNLNINLVVKLIWINSLIQLVFCQNKKSNLTLEKANKLLKNILKNKKRGQKSEKQKQKLAN